MILLLLSLGFIFAMLSFLLCFRLNDEVIVCCRFVYGSLRFGWIMCRFLLIAKSVMLFICCLLFLNLIARILDLLLRFLVLYAHKPAFVLYVFVLRISFWINSYLLLFHANNFFVKFLFIFIHIESSFSQKPLLIKN